MNFNKVTLVGRLTKDPELRSTVGGQFITTAILAVNRKWLKRDGTKQDDSQFFPIVLWGKQAELFAKLTKRGHEVLIEGRMEHRSFTDSVGNNKTVSEVVCEKFQFGQRPNQDRLDDESANEETMLPEDLSPNDQDTPF